MLAVMAAGTRLMTAVRTFETGVSEAGESQPPAGSGAPENDQADEGDNDDQSNDAQHAPSNLNSTVSAPLS